MLRDEVTERLGVLDTVLPIEDMVVDGYPIWPALRARIGMRVHAPLSDKSVLWRRIYRRTSRIVSASLRPLGRSSLLIGGPDPSQAGPGPSRDLSDRSSEVVMISFENRAQRIGEIWHNIISDPIARALRRAGHSVQIWSFGAPRLPSAEAKLPLDRLIESVNIDSVLSAAPSWFDTLQDNAQSMFGLELHWPTERKFIRTLRRWALAIRRLVQQAKPQVLIVDGWYDAPVQSVLWAAHRLGTTVIDVQHGLQGLGHFAYSGFRLDKEKFRVALPSTFWVWGERDRKNLLLPGGLARSAGQITVIGNRWLEEWRGPLHGDRAKAVSAVRHAAKGRRIILITLQKGVPFRKDLEILLQQEYRDAVFFIRLHRRMNLEARKLERELSALSDNLVNVTDATELPLYAIMRECAWHMTWYSTCTVEALAFGVPSIVLHKSAETAFDHLITRDVVLATDADRASKILQHRQPPSRGACQREALGYFASLNDADESAAFTLH